MLEFFRKYENRDDKIVRVNSIRMTKINQFTSILYAFGVC